MGDAFKHTLAEALSVRRSRTYDVEGRDAAVLVPFVAGDPSLILTVRSETLPTHQGQISFPGGSIDETDANVESAALREAQEEIGLDPARVEILGNLDATPTFVTGFVVTPVVGWLDEVPDLRPNPAEVSEVLTVPLHELTEEIRAEPGFVHGGRSFPTEAWIWNDHVIWGFTARILRELLQLLAGVGLVKEPGATASWTAWPPATR